MLTFASGYHVVVLKSIPTGLSKGIGIVNCVSLALYYWRVCRPLSGESPSGSAGRLHRRAASGHLMPGSNSAVMSASDSGSGRVYFVDDLGLPN